MKLNLFCGFDHLGGYINIDAVREFSPDMVWNLQGKLPYSLGSISEIRIQDGFEHLNYHDAQRMLRHWSNLLEKGGGLFIQLPDWDLVDKNNLENVFGGLDWKGVQLGDFGVHKWGYTKNSIQRILELNGLEIIELVNVLGNIQVKARKL